MLRLDKRILSHMQFDMNACISVEETFEAALHQQCFSVTHPVPSVLIDKQQKTPAAPPRLLSPPVEKDTRQSQSGNMPEPKQKWCRNCLSRRTCACFICAMDNKEWKAWQHDSQQCFFLTLAQRSSFVSWSNMILVLKYYQHNEALFGDMFECWFT